MMIDDDVGVRKKTLTPSRNLINVLTLSSNRGTKLRMELGC